MSKPSNLVYSTDKALNQSIQLQLKQQLKEQLTQHSRSDKKPSATVQTDAHLNDGVVRIHRETKGRSGKGVCIITGLTLPADELKALAKKLKQHCGTGGTIKDHTIEIQGDQRDKIKAFLEVEGHRVKLAGG